MFVMYIGVMYTDDVNFECGNKHWLSGKRNYRA